MEMGMSITSLIMQIYRRYARRYFAISHDTLIHTSRPIAFRLSDNESLSICHGRVPQTHIQGNPACE